MAIGNVIYTPRKALVDNLLSTAANLPLSANQGKVLGDAVNQLNTDMVERARKMELLSSTNDALEKSFSYDELPTDFVMLIFRQYNVQGLYLCTTRGNVISYTEISKASNASVSKNSDGKMVISVESWTLVEIFY